MVKKECVAIYSAALLQGITLVAFPAASTILTSPDAFNFSSTAYGSLFIPQALLSILAAALNPKLCRMFTSKSIFLFGLVANLFAMALLAASVITMNDQVLAHTILLFATACLGLGFGLTVPTLNAMGALLYPTRIDNTLLIINALLGIGTALAPVFIALFTAIGFWWELPLLLVVLINVLLFFSQPLSLPGGNIQTKWQDYSERSIPSRFWIFAIFALLYGIIETINGNWVSIYMSTHLKASLAIQSLALTAFWGMVTFGRLFFAAIDKSFREQLAYQISPFISAVAFLIIAALPEGENYMAIFAFGLIGFGCSTLLPLTISFGSQQLKSMATSIPGMFISFYLLGYGIAAFGVGPLVEAAHIGLRDIYLFGAAISVILGFVSLKIVKIGPNRSI